ncbi:MAG: DNA alkylation repair protein [Microgenomates group bacterium]
MNTSIISSIRRELQQNADEKTKESAGHFFKEAIRVYGVKTGIVVAIAKKYWKEIKALSKKEIFAMCEELYTSGIMEESFVVSTWVPNLAKQFEKKDLDTFYRWINSYITNWASCDGFCNHTLGEYIEKYPEQVSVLKQWATSKNRWVKRAAAVSLIVPAKHGKFLGDVFEIADILLLDTDDMVQKGYGWMLKEASRLHQQEVFAYVVKHKKVMPRTALRYAIELMPQPLRKKAMEK